MNSLAGIAMHLDDKLKKILSENNVETYGPAYNGESVGLDLYYTGDTAVTLVKEVWEKKLLSTGVRVVLPPNTVGLLMERGSIVKTPLKLRAGVIDPGYTGEIFVNLINPYNEPYTISPGDKLPVQLVSIANVVTTYNEVSTDDFNVLTSLSNRKEGKIGSSN